MGKFVDLTGKTFGELTVVERAEDRIQPSGQHCRMWKCICSCGKECIVSAQNLKNGHTQSCGHIQRESTSIAHKLNLVGQTFGELTVIEEAGRYISPNGSRQLMWKCVCSCGKEIITHGSSLVKGTSRSCGHVRRKDLSGQIFGWLQVIKPAETIYGKDGEADTMWECRCLNCGRIKNIRTASLTSGAIKSDGCLGSSWNEIQIQQLLQQIGVKNEKEYTFDDLRADDTNAVLRFDFAIFDNDMNLKGLIEFNGPHHYIERFKGWGDRQRLVTDPLKQKYCLKNNIPLLVIPYTDKEYEKCIFDFLAQINVSYVNPVPSSN